MSIWQLRASLKRYIDHLKKGQQSSSEKLEQPKSQLDQIRQNWPQLVPQSSKDKLVNIFKKQTSSDALATVTCASCSERTLKVECKSIPFNSIDLSPLRRPDARPRDAACPDVLVDDDWLGGSYTAPHLTELNNVDSDILIDHREIVGGTGETENTQALIKLCSECYRFLLKGKAPPLLLANHVFLREVPPELKDLKVVEEAMIARCRAKCWAIQLKEEDSDITQQGMKRHIIVYPQQTSKVARILPPSVEELKFPMCVIFVGNTPPTKEWLRTKAKALAVRPDKVRRALLWLKEHNRDLALHHDLLSLIFTLFSFTSINSSHLFTTDNSISDHRRHWLGN
ncbi:hypothetical protein PM082_018149 [Marasmius tenuissimus]|nr:hypothetical protein PM082_018149 [Marasmius tenuissimus]